MTDEWFIERVRSHIERNATSVGVPYDRNRFPDVRVNDLLDKCGMLRYPYDLGGRRRMAVPGEINAHDPVIRGKRLGYRGHISGAASPSVEKENGRGRCVSRYRAAQHFRSVRSGGRGAVLRLR